MTGCAAALAFGPTSARATPGSGVTGMILAKGKSAGVLKVKGKGRTDVIVRSITIARPLH